MRTSKSHRHRPFFVIFFDFSHYSHPRHTTSAPVTTLPVKKCFLRWKIKHYVLITKHPAWHSTVPKRGHR